MTTMLFRSSYGFISNVSLRSPKYHTTVSSKSLQKQRRFLSSSALLQVQATDDEQDSISTTDNDDKEEEQEQQELLLHPNQFGLLEYPKSLSPSSILEFKKCPQSFLFQYLYKIKQPTTTALAKGSMCHEALEKLFDLDVQDRTLENLHNLLRVSWQQNRLSDQYKFLFDIDGDDEAKARDIQAERVWGQSALQLLTNYYNVEDPKSIVRPNPMKREYWLHCHMPVDPSLGVTSSSSSSAASSKSLNENTPTMYIRGIVDRLDMIRIPSADDDDNNNRKGSVALKIVDYKTGKAPDLKYSRSMNEKIVEENFFQLKIYALLIRELQRKNNSSRRRKNKDDDDLDQALLNLQYLQLFYLTSHDGEGGGGGAKQWEYDLGQTQQQRDEVLQDIHQDLSNVWTNIRKLIDLQDPKAFVGCDRSFCYCHKCRTKFVSGSVWEP